MFPLGHLAFWDLSSPPLVDVCGESKIKVKGVSDGGKTMEWKFIVPGLFSTYALQSSTFLERYTVYRSAVECPYHDQLLTYQPNETSGTSCGTSPKNSLLVRVDAFGVVQAVHDVAYANGTMYNGSLTGVAVSTGHGCVWACGRASWGNQRWGEWQIFRFDLADVKKGSSTINMKHVETLSTAFKTAERCFLSWKPSAERGATALYKGQQ